MLERGSSAAQEKAERGVCVHEMIEDESNVTRERITFITEGEKKCNIASAITGYIF